jgi:hypothetical protein
MSLHKLTAGSGYDYLTRQVAALDATDKGHAGLASYYTERGESPGVWVGPNLCAAPLVSLSGLLLLHSRQLCPTKLISASLVQQAPCVAVADTVAAEAIGDDPNASLAQPQIPTAE